MPSVETSFDRKLNVCLRLRAAFELLSQFDLDQPGESVALDELILCLLCGGKKSTKLAFAFVFDLRPKFSLRRKERAVHLC
jgi:hypothetical protein